MRESERKRLVEVIDKAFMEYVSFSTEMALAGNYDGVGTFGEFASKRLLDNGVIVPACKTGQKTYGKYGVELGEVKGIVFETYRGEDSLDYVLDWNYGDYDAFTDDDVGNTIFFSREEAEAKLKGGEADE